MIKASAGLNELAGCLLTHNPAQRNYAAKAAHGARGE